MYVDDDIHIQRAYLQDLIREKVWAIANRYNHSGNFNGHNKMAE